MADFDLIDSCSEYIEVKNAHYLAKEGCIVFYSSITGRKSDYAWVEHTISETLRIIKAMLLTTKQAESLLFRSLVVFMSLG